MGDRANVFVVNEWWEDNNPKHVGVYLYTHWEGSVLPITLRKALQRGKPRWADMQYLTRIIFDTMTEGKQGEETGFGISAVIGDNSYPILVVDCVNRTVGFATEGEEPECDLGWMSFEDWCDEAVSIAWPT